jgi:hypothetical protein
MPTPTDCNSAAFGPSPVSSNIRGEKYRMALMPDIWLKNAIRYASMMGTRSPPSTVPYNADAVFDAGCQNFDGGTRSIEAVWKPCL